MTRPNLILWWIAYGVLRSLAASCYRTRHLTPPLQLEGPVIWVSKHCYYWDIPMLGQITRRHAKRMVSFEMASFHGYAWLGQVSWLLNNLGGFSVMRPKDLLRLRKTGSQTREQLREIMAKANAKADARRAGILRANETYCFFPEGTRETERLRNFKSTHELTEARRLADEEGIDVTVVPVALNYGKRSKRFIPWITRAPMTMEALEPISIKSMPPAELSALVEARLREAWQTPEEVLRVGAQSH
ncbi:MAG: lysophospholipid acyltransferase family protein [Planctomycetota bacterium]